MELKANGVAPSISDFNKHEKAEDICGGLEVR